MLKYSKHNINEQINSDQVRLVSSTGEQLGIFSIKEALALARENNLDLVELTSSEEHTVCKIMNYTKFIYDQKKKAKENQRKNKKSQVEIKEIWLRPVTEKHDIETKIKKAKIFLTSGNKVKFVVKFKGREIVHVDQGRELLDSILESFPDAKIESPISLQGKQLVVILS